MRVVLLAGGEEVGNAGMAVDADLDRTTGVLRVQPGSKASVGLMLSRDTVPSFRIVVIETSTDMVLVQTPEIPVKLGI